VNSNSFQGIIKQTLDVIKRFEKIENKPWGINGAMIELMKQVGDLSALIMMQEKYYPANRDKDNPRYQVSKEKIADELSDLLFIIVRIADIYQIDLEPAYIEALKHAESYLKNKGV
jgi:NTP pyrophosphatase (non-canonical NTP hydrolase)